MDLEFKTKLKKHFDNDEMELYISECEKAQAESIEEGEKDIFDMFLSHFISDEIQNIEKQGGRNAFRKYYDYCNAENLASFRKEEDKRFNKATYLLRSLLYLSKIETDESINSFLFIVYWWAHYTYYAKKLVSDDIWKTNILHKELFLNLVHDIYKERISETIEKEILKCKESFDGFMERLIICKKYERADFLDAVFNHKDPYHVQPSRSYQRVDPLTELAIKRYGEGYRVINDRLLIYVNDNTKQIWLGGHQFAYSDLLYFNVSDEGSIVNESKSSANLGSVMGRSIIGGLTFGALGAIIGGATASKTVTTNSTVIHDYRIVVSTRKADRPFETIKVGKDEQLLNRIVNELNRVIGQK